MRKEVLDKYIYILQLYVAGTNTELSYIDIVNKLTIEELDYVINRFFKNE